MKRLILFISALSIFVSCKKDKQTAEPIDMGYDYYPDQMGRFIVYECDSTVYPDVGSTTQFYKFRIKEKIDSFFTDNQGRAAHRISRYKQWLQYDTLSSVDTTWHLQDIWWGNKTAATAEVVEENIRYIKLAFPAEEEKTWNGNAQNTMGQWDYEYTSVDEPLTLGSLHFSKALHVKQYTSGNIPLFYKRYDEKYARGAGMVYKEFTDYTWEQDINGNILIGTIKYGTKYKMQAIQYGTE